MILLLVDTSAYTVRPELPDDDKLSASDLRYSLCQLDLESLTNEQRAAFFSEVTDGYCQSCGKNDPNCQCTNDD